KLEYARDGRGDVDVGCGQRVVKARFEVWASRQQRDRCVGRRKAAVVAATVDRARIADAWLPGHCDPFVIIEADDYVRRSSGHRWFSIDETHRQRANDLAVTVADENCAELLATLQAGNGGLYHVAVAIRNEQVVASGVGGHD